MVNTCSPCAAFITRDLTTSNGLATNAEINPEHIAVAPWRGSLEAR
jgi:hypothetical protein